MAVVVAAIFIGLPLGMAVFLCWRAYQMAYGGRTHLAHQWLARKTPGIERYAKLFAARDIFFAVGCMVFIALLLMFPANFTVWPGVLAFCAAIHQSITAYAIYKVQKAAKPNPSFHRTASGGR